MSQLFKKLDFLKIKQLIELNVPIFDQQSYSFERVTVLRLWHTLGVSGSPECVLPELGIDMLSPTSSTSTESVSPISYN